MTSEDMQHARLTTIAQMAATLEAGDRANPSEGERENSTYYVRRATKIYDAVDAAEAKGTTTFSKSVAPESPQ